MYNSQTVKESDEQIMQRSQTTEKKNLLSYLDLWEHKANNPDEHKVYCREIFEGNKKAIMKNSNKDNWLKNDKNYNTIIFGGKKNRSTEYKINLRYFYTRALIVSNAVRKAENKINDDNPQEQCRLPMRSCHLRMRYWIYKCFSFVTSNDQDRKILNKHIIEIETSLGLRSQDNNPMSGMLKMAQKFAGSKDMAKLGQSLMSNFQGSNFDINNPDPDQMGDMVSKAFKNPEMRNFFQNFTKDMRESGLMEQAEQVASNLSGEAKANEIMKKLKEEPIKLEDISENKIEPSETPGPQEESTEMSGPQEESTETPGPQEESSETSELQESTKIPESQEESSETPGPQKSHKDPQDSHEELQPSEPQEESGVSESQEEFHELLKPQEEPKSRTE